MDGTWTPGPEHSPRASRALQKLVEQDPAFGALSLWCRHRDGAPEPAVLFQREADRWTATSVVREVAPAWTDGTTVFYGAQFADWTLEEQVAVCAHELLHVALRHVPRARALTERLGPVFRADLYNVATDAIINQTLLAAGFQLPRPCIFLCELLRDISQEAVPPQEALGKWDAEMLYARLLSRAETDPAPVAAFLASHATLRDLALEGAAGRADAQEEVEWQGRLDRALTLGRAAGRGLGTLGLKLADLPRSRTPWEVIIRRAVAKAVAGAPRPDWSRPARRWLGCHEEARLTGAPDVPYEPRLAALMDRKRVAVGVDVSGSISTPLLRRFAGEIAAIGKRTGAELHVLVFDTAVRSHRRLTGVDFMAEVLALDFARGGGTNFVEVVDSAAALDPSIIVVLTDLYGGFGAAPNGIPVVWCVPEDGGHPEPAPFGRTLRL